METIDFDKVSERPEGWRKPPEGTPRQCWNIWSMREKKCLTKEQAYDQTQRDANPDLSPYYCKYHSDDLGWAVYHMGHRKLRPGQEINRNEDLLGELGVRACYHLFANDSFSAIRSRAQSAAEKRGEYGRVE